MTEEDDRTRVSQPQTDSSSSITKQRKKRKWDVPAESLVSARVAVPGALPLGNAGSVVGLKVPGVLPVSGASLINTLPTGYGTLQQVLLSPSIQQHASTLVQKLLPKIQEELIAREIVINDAEPGIRYKLTKRQTQEEIQKCTGAIVITRGKYRPPNGPPDGEKPLYLHISAGAHLETAADRKLQLETTADRIKAVDHAAAMVEEMLKQSCISNGAKATLPLSTSVYLGFDPDPSLHIATRIRGPNDQYVNHIMNETGATVLLRGRGSGSFGVANSEGEQPLHLFLSSSNSKSLDHAKLLAENLLDTICAECGASRVSSCKVYNAVPPPQQLLSGVQGSVDDLKDNALPSFSSTMNTNVIKPPAVSLATSSIITPILPQGTGPNMVSAPQPTLTGGTCYNGYGGIYPQATPLQQVALVLRQSASPVGYAASPVIDSVSTESTSTTSSSAGKEKRPPQKRKFQELPVAMKGPLKPHQEFSQETGQELVSQSILRNTSTMPAPMKLVPSSSIGMPPPPPPTKTMPPPPAKTVPPPPPKFNSISSVQKVPDQSSIMEPPPPRVMDPPPPPKFNSLEAVQKGSEQSRIRKADPAIVPDTLISLMQYGDEDDDLEEETTEEPLAHIPNMPAAPKPFWAV